MKDALKKSLAEAIAAKTALKAAAVEHALEQPKNKDFGDIAFPCFLLAKAWKISPLECAKKLQSDLVLPAGISGATAAGPFLNFKFDSALLARALIASYSQMSGRSWQEISGEAAPKKTVIVEYSSPNIAKPFHVGHLRATLIGNSLDRVYRFLAYKTISINHLGDWGTQFGFVWAGCELWGKPAQASVNELVELYRRATALKERQEANEIRPEEKNLPNVNDIARNFFLDLESGTAYAKDFWKWCLDISLEYFKHTYKRLGVSFDHYTGESFYADKIDDVAAELRNAGILRESQKALGVDLGEDLGFARVFTPDGRSLYLTRDIATAEYRAKEYNFDQTIYVVGAPQTLHFQQLVGILKLLKKPYAEKITHVSFGHVLGMKTRGEGEVIELNEFIDEAIERALAAYREQVSKRPEGLNELEVAEHVAIAAILFSTLSRNRLKDVNFKWEHALEFQGDSGPYLLYACARINGIKEKALEAGVSLRFDIDTKLLSEDCAHKLISLLADFAEVLSRTVADSEPCHLANYALELARDFSKSYLELKVIGVEKPLAEARLVLFETVRQVLITALELLGIEPLERM